VSSLLPCVLCSNVLTDLLSVDASSFGVDIDLVVLGNDVKKMLEVGSHLHDDQVLPVGESLEGTVNLGDDVVFLQLLHCGS
jgi:hypothetical protein